MRCKLQAGLTLIEIMIAVAILAIISAIAIPVYQGYLTEARYGTAMKDIRQMQLILDDLAFDNQLDDAVEPGTYTEGADIDVYTSSTGVSCDPAADGVGPKWLDPWGQSYRYQRVAGSQNPQVFELRTAGPDATYDNADDFCIRSDGDACG
jgi:prepilin-type N-terminal cleavage/methylation domain-containing protein